MNHLSHPIRGFFASAALAAALLAGCATTTQPPVTWSSASPELALDAAHAACQHETRQALNGESFESPLFRSPAAQRQLEARRFARATYIGCMRDLGWQPSGTGRIPEFDAIIIVV